MKKILLIALIAGLSVVRVTADDGFGVKADGNLSNVLLSGMSDANSAIGLGWGLGGYMAINFGKYFTLQPELHVLFQNSTLKQNEIDHNFRFAALEMPIYAMGNFIFSNKNKLHVGAGSYIKTGLTGKDETMNRDLYAKPDANEAYMQRLDVGLCAVLGYEFSFGLQINAGYRYGFANMLKADREVADMRNQMVTLGLGISI